MSAWIYREPNSIIVNVKGGLIIDHGKLHNAIPSSDGTYLFSESGAGVAPLVVVGELNNIIEEFIKHKDKIITNKIMALPNIYLSINEYTPSKRFTGVFPIGDGIVHGVRDMLDFLPIHPITEITIATYQTVVQPVIKKIAEEVKKKKKKPQILYARFSYIEEEGSILIGSKNVSFQEVLNKMFHIKETRV